MALTHTGRRIKGPEFIARMYGSGLREHALLTHSIINMDFSDIEARTVAYYSDCDPRNHFGKFANRRF